MNKIKNYFRESKEELKKVKWPTPKQIKDLAIVTLIITFGMAIILGVIDWGFYNLFQYLLKIK